MTAGTVSGREYKATRARGFLPDWKPQPKTLHLIGRVQDILARYQAQLPLTIRQIFYILVGSQEGYDKTEAAYNRLAETLNKARRAGLIDFTSIRDDGTQSTGFPGWDSPGQWRDYIGRLARGYKHDLTDGQPFHTELWVEAGGMVPQAAAVANPYGIITYSAGGFNGTTDKYETAVRLAGWIKAGKPAIVLHCGDYDPSGLAIVDSLAEDVTEFTYRLANQAWRGYAIEHTTDVAPLEFRRIVVTPEQIDRYSLPSAPQKGTDNRGEWMDATVQAEALPPDILAAEITDAIDVVIDAGALEAARELGDTERAAVRAAVARMTFDD